MADDNDSKVEAELKFNFRNDDVERAERMADALERMAKAEGAYNTGVDQGNRATAGRRGRSGAADNPWSDGAATSQYDPATGQIPTRRIPFGGAYTPGASGRPAVTRIPDPKPVEYYGYKPWGDHHLAEQTVMEGGWDKGAIEGLKSPSMFQRAEKGFASFAGRYGGWAAPAAGIAAVNGAMYSRDSAELARYSGNTGGDAIRAAYESNWLSRQALGIADRGDAFFSGESRETRFGKVEIDAQKAEIRRQREQAIGRPGEVTGSIAFDFHRQRLEVQSQLGAIAQDPRTATIGMFDRSTVGSETAYREAVARQGVRGAGYDIARQGIALGTEAADVGTSLEKTERQRLALIQRRNKAEIIRDTDAGAGTVVGAYVPNGGTVDAKRLEAVKEIERIEKDLENNVQQQNKLLEQQQGIRQKIAENARDAKQNQLDGMQVEQRLWQSRAEVARSQSANIAEESPLKRSFIIGQLELFRKNENLDTLAQDTRDVAKRFAGPEYLKRAEAFGEQTDLGQYTKQAFPNVYRDTIQDAEANAQRTGENVIRLKLQIQKEFLEQVDDQVLAEKGQKAFEGVANKVFDIRIAQVLEAIKAKNGPGR